MPVRIKTQNAMISGPQMRNIIRRCRCVSLIPVWTRGSFGLKSRLASKSTVRAVTVNLAIGIGRYTAGK